MQLVYILCCLVAGETAEYPVVLLFNDIGLLALSRRKFEAVVCRHQMSSTAALYRKVSLDNFLAVEVSSRSDMTISEMEQYYGYILCIVLYLSFFNHLEFGTVLIYACGTHQINEPIRN